MSDARRVAFVRHGETDWNEQRRIQGLTDVPLNDVGREQSRSLGEQLASLPWSTIVSSPLARARETASVLAETAGLTVGDPVARLTERAYGVAEGLSVDTVNERWPDGDYPGSEPFLRLTERGRLAVDEVLGRSHGDVVIVSHGALLRATISALTGRPWPRILNGTATVLEFRAGIWEAAALPERVHQESR